MDVFDQSTTEAVIRSTFLIQKGTQNFVDSSIIRNPYIATKPEKFRFLLGVGVV